jgi:hypothetical protein
MLGINNKSVMIKFNVVLMAYIAYVTLDDKCNDTFQNSFNSVLRIIMVKGNYLYCCGE